MRRLECSQLLTSAIMSYVDNGPMARLYDVCSTLRDWDFERNGSGASYGEKQF